MTADSQQEAVVEVIDFIEDAFEGKGLDKVNGYLRDFDVTAKGPRLTVVALRCSFRVRDQLPQWYSLRDRATAAFKDLPDFNRRFRGLL